MSVAKTWHTLFLEERPSIGLSFFRIFVALTVGLHVFPSFFHLDDNYLSTAFKTTNPIFFTDGVVDVVQQSPDWLVLVFVAGFTMSWFCFLVGLCSQVSCALLTLCCYYFYALNNFHIGTLSWDILLVTMFLMCVTKYHGDYFSIDALRRQDPLPWKRPRPFFIQRLLQLQIASTFFFTGLYKIIPAGNWLSANPLLTLMNYPVMGVTKNFLLKEWLAGQPSLCYGIGILVILMELSLPFWLFYPKTRRCAIILACVFHVLLILTLDVPTIFFFLFPAQLLLFIHPQAIVDWIEEQRRRSFKLKVLYDGKCGFCQASVERLKIMDLWGHLVYEPVLDSLSEMKLEDAGKVYGGFYAFRQMSWYLPMLYPILLVAYLPGVALMGRACYAIIARNRYLFHRGRSCADNQCFPP